MRWYLTYLSMFGLLVGLTLYYMYKTPYTEPPTGVIETLKVPTK